MMEFGDATQQFFLQEVTFRGTPDRSDRVAFSTGNPEKCTVCHGKVPRPV